MLNRQSYAGAIFALAVMFMWNSAPVKAQNTVQFGTGLGDLTYSASSYTDTCYIEWSEEYTVPYTYEVYTLGSFVYYPPSTTGLASVSIPGGFTYIEFSGPAAGSGLSDSCPTSTPTGGSTPITYKSTNSNYGYTITLGDPFGELSAGFSLNGTAGFITPKYVVMGVTYAPPGASSNVQYTNTTSVGNTTTISNSFSNNVGFSVTDTMGGSIPAGWFFNGKFTITSTESTNYQQGSSSSTTTTVTKASTVAYKTSGTPTEAPVNSDYDYIWLWVNPEVFITYTPAFSSYPGYIKVTGLGMDPNDPVTGKPQTGVTYTAGPDVIEVQVGCLNGHFSCASDLAWNNGEIPGSFITSGLLARTWQSAADGYSWPSGEQGLSYDDVCAILNIDPFAVTPSQCPTKNDYTLLNSLPSTSSDGRFSKIPYPPNPIQYPVGGGNESYSMVQTDTQSQSTGNSSQIQQGFSESESFNTSAFWGLLSNTITFKESDTLTWNYSSLNTITTTTTLTNALSVTGPPTTPTYPAGQPVEFIGYQDNTFGTFAFMPVDYCPSGSIICTQ